MKTFKQFTEAILIGTSKTWPIKEIPVKQFYHKNLEKDADEKAIEKYMIQLKKGKYEPVSVSYKYSLNDVLDGSHRIIAAHRLGLKNIKAYVEPGTKIQSL